MNSDAGALHIRKARFDNAVYVSIVAALASGWTASSDIECVLGLLLVHARHRRIGV